MRKAISSTLLSYMLLGCELEERPSYAITENTLPTGGPTIQYDPDSGLGNIDQITASLSEDNAEKFNHSLGWYSTESSFNLKKMEGKTARQLVDIVNCLKKAAAEDKQKSASTNGPCS